MTHAAASFLKIAIFLMLGLFFRKGKLLNKSGIEGIKKIIIYLAIPAVLFLSFSQLEFKLSFIPVILAIFCLNLLLFWVGMGFYKLTGSKDRLMPLFMTTMNFALLGIPLYEAVYGIENLHNYTIFGIGHEIFMWFVFYFLLRWFLTKGSVERGINWGFIKSPIIWSIIVGCFFGILKIDLSAENNWIFQGVIDSIKSISFMATPLILIFIGYNISFSISLMKSSFKYISLRLTVTFILGYLVKIIILDHLIEKTVYFDSAYFLLLSLPPVFSIPILASDYLDENELTLLNNTIVLHAVITIILFSIISFSLL